MAEQAGSFGAAISDADSKATVLDDRLDAEDFAAFRWLRSHRIDKVHRIVIGLDVLSPEWHAKTKRFTDQHSAERYLHLFLHNSTAMHALRTLAGDLNHSAVSPHSDLEVLAAVAADMPAGRPWVIEFGSRPPASRFVRKTSPAVFTKLNPRYGTNVDFTFIASMEGNQWLRGYVPMKSNKVLGRSGMTVATGFDIGQWKVSELNDLGFSDALMKKIQIFAAPNNFKGLDKAQVAAKVAKLGPVPELSADEADQCDGVVFGKILGDAVKAWNSQKSPGVPDFKALPSGWQTVWFSRVYQEGPQPKSADAKAFRSAALAGQWQSAITKLSAYKEYTSRANQEAALLRQQLPPAVQSNAGAAGAAGLPQLRIP